MTSLKLTNAHELLRPALVEQLLTDHEELPPDEALESLKEVRFGMDVAVNGFSYSHDARLLLATVIADIVEPEKCGPFQLVVVCPTNAATSSVLAVIEKVCGFIPDLRCAAFPELDAEDAKGVAEKVIKTLPHVLIGTAQSLIQLLQLAEIQLDNVGVVCFHCAEESLTQDTYLTVSSLLQELPHLKQLFMTGQSLDRTQVEQKLKHFIHDLHYVDLSTEDGKSKPPEILSESVAAEGDKKRVIYSGVDSTYKRWIEACAQVQWKIPALHSLAKQREDHNVDEQKEDTSISDWVTYWSAQYEQPYYYNKSTGQSSWKMPSGPQERL